MELQSLLLASSRFFSPLLVLITLSIAGTTLGGSVLTRGDFEENPRASIQYAVRSIELGLNLEKQDELRKREFALREEHECTNCDRPVLPKGLACEYGYTPFIQHKEGSDCSCVKEYKCCNKPPCPKLTDEDWKKCDNNETYGIGIYYPVGADDCCDCPVVHCLKCPEIILSRPPAHWGTNRRNTTHKFFWCENDCDEAVLTKEANNCPKYICKRKTKPREDEQICNDACHDNETVTDECGFHKKVCKCRYPPECQPPPASPIACHTVSQVPLGYYGCGIGTDTCEECYQWKYDLDKPVNAFFRCKPCEIEKMKELPCGAFQTKCECRKPINCQPTRPDDISCHKLVRVNSTDPDSSTCGAGGECEPCYHWEYVAEEYTVKTATCNDKCQFKRPKSTECGSDEECVCIGKKKEQCQPIKPQPHKCYDVMKVMINDSYMCNEEDYWGAAERMCAQCFTWEFTEKSCPVQEDFKECKPECQREVKVHTECDCYERQCRSTVIEDCEPTKPDVDLTCYTDPVKKYRPGIYSYDSSNNMCVRCFQWEYEHKKFPPVDTCNLRTLPSKCFTDYTVEGTCGALVTKCQRNHLKCTEEYDDEHECQLGHNKVSLKTTCGDARDACLDCKDKDFAMPRWSDTYHDDCYDIKKLTILGKCSVPIKRKKKCQYEGRLPTTECPIKGQKRRIFYDKCDCPTLVCAGCPANIVIDLQLILDSSGSITRSGWMSLIEFLKINFIDSIFGNSIGRLAVAKYGTNTEILQELYGPVSTDWLNTKKYDWVDMGNTYTGNALDNAFPSYQAKTNGTSAKKVLVVLTDGVPTPGSMPVTEAIKQWNNWGVMVFAVGFGDINMAGLQEISPTHAYKMSNLADAERGIVTEVVPAICEQKKIVIDN